MCALSVDGPDNDDPEGGGRDWSTLAMILILGGFSAGAVVTILIAVIRALN